VLHLHFTSYSLIPYSIAKSKLSCRFTGRYEIAGPQLQHTAVTENTFQGFHVTFNGNDIWISYNWKQHLGTHNFTLGNLHLRTSHYDPWYNIISTASPECKGTTFKKTEMGERHWESSLTAILEKRRLLINERLREILVASLSHRRGAWKRWRLMAGLRNWSDVQGGQGVYASGARLQ
jgi:hypothetical protein